jgi:hypothetical protein
LRCFRRNFSLEPDKFFPYAQIDVVEFPEDLGGDKIINTLEHNGSPPPIFETDEDRLSFAVTIYKHPEF